MQGGKFVEISLPETGDCLKITWHLAVISVVIIGIDGISVKLFEQAGCACGICPY